MKKKEEKKKIYSVKWFKEGIYHLPRYKRMNSMCRPMLVKTVANVAVKNKDEYKNAFDQLKAITGQKPCWALAKRSNIDFKIKKGDKIGVKVTLRNEERQYKFLSSLISDVLPEIPAFNGISPHSFDENGNCNLGIREQIYFPQIKGEEIGKVKGIGISIEIKNCATKKESLTFLQELGFPFLPISSSSKRK